MLVRILDRFLESEEPNAVQRSNLAKVKSLLANWDGGMTLNSTAASIYAYWQFKFNQRLFEKVTASNFEFWSVNDRLSLVDNAWFYKFQI